MLNEKKKAMSSSWHCAFISGWISLFPDNSRGYSCGGYFLLSSENHYCLNMNATRILLVVMKTVFHNFVGVWYYASKHASIYQLRALLSIQTSLQWTIGFLAKYINFILDVWWLIRIISWFTTIARIIRYYENTIIIHSPNWLEMCTFLIIFYVRQ